MLVSPSSMEEDHWQRIQPQTELNQFKAGGAVTAQPPRGEVNTKRRSYMYNTVTGQPQRVIRKRMRKTGNQLDMLNEEFDSNPHWSKETLYLIS